VLNLLCLHHGPFEPEVGLRQGVDDHGHPHPLSGGPVGALGGLWLDIDAALATEAGAVPRKPAIAARAAVVHTVASGEALTACVVVLDDEPQPATATPTARATTTARSGDGGTTRARALPWGLAWASTTPCTQHIARVRTGGVRPLR
jgi:hypothetical protein